MWNTAVLFKVMLADVANHSRYWNGCVLTVHGRTIDEYVLNIHGWHADNTGKCCGCNVSGQFFGQNVKVAWAAVNIQLSWCVKINRLHRDWINCMNILHTRRNMHMWSLMSMMVIFTQTLGGDTLTQNAHVVALCCGHLVGLKYGCCWCVSVQIKCVLVAIDCSTDAM